MSSSSRPGPARTAGTDLGPAGGQAAGGPARPAGPTTIGPGEVAAWIVDLDAARGTSPGVLDAAERDRAARYLRPLDGARFAASRAAVRMILAGYARCPPQQLRFLAGSRGQPRLAGSGLRFSLARSGGLALLAVARGPVGADLEEAAPRAGLADLAAARFSPAEAGCIAAGCGESEDGGFYRHWTAREAYLKAAGHGLAGPRGAGGPPRLRETELICAAPGGPVIRVRGQEQRGWRLSLASPVPGYAAAIAARAPVVSWRRLGG